MSLFFNLIDSVINFFTLYHIAYSYAPEYSLQNSIRTANLHLIYIKVFNHWWSFTKHGELDNVTSQLSFKVQVLWMVTYYLINFRCFNFISISFNYCKSINSPLKPSCLTTCCTNAHWGTVQCRTTTSLETQRSIIITYNRSALPDCSYHRCLLSQHVVGQHSYLIYLSATCRESTNTLSLSFSYI